MHSRERHAMQKAVRKEKMKVVERPVSLRDVLEKLKAEGDVIESDKPVNPDLELTGLQKHLDGACPMLFNKVKGKPNHRLLTNLFGDMNVINKMFGWTDDTDRTRKLAYALSHPIKPQEVLQSVAPCQEVVIENPKDVNEYMVPIRHTTYEPELTVGSGIRCVTGEHFDGGSDLGYNRMNFRWGNVGTFQISPGSHMWQVVNKYYKTDAPVPITMCFRVPPASKPIVFALGVHMLDDHNIDTTVREATIFELCNRLQPGIIQDVVIPYSMTDWGGCIIQVKKRHQIDEGWQRNFLGAILSCSQGMRLAIAVSEDVDPYSMDEVM